MALNSSLFSDRLKLIFEDLIFDTEECILWKATIDSCGYGRVHTKIGKDTKVFSSHRLSYAIFNGEVPDDKQVLHSCDNPSCINPKHLFLGSQEDNMLDCLRKGRYNPYPGNKAITLQRRTKKNNILYGTSKSF